MHVKVTWIGDIVRSAREARGLAQSALAKEIAVSKRTVVALENNQRKPTYEVFCRLVHALGISADLIVYPDRAIYTVEQEQLFREWLTCGEREQKIVVTVIQSLLRALRQDEPEKQG